jgi:hypothetical protein
MCARIWEPSASSVLMYFLNFKFLDRIDRIIMIFFRTTFQMKVVRFNPPSAEINVLFAADDFSERLQE